MRLLHTSDWHLSKRIAGRDRTEEYRAVLDELIDVAETHQVDAVIHSGDLFDRAIPPLEALELGIGSLLRLADGGRRPVVVVAGNHDSPQLFDTLAPLVAPFGVHLVGALKAPEDGGVRRFDLPAGPLAVSCLPFVPQGKVVDAMVDPGEAYTTYADRLRALAAAHQRVVVADHTDAVTVFAAHFMVSGVAIARGKGPRGEKELSIGEAYAATSAAVPTGYSYVALGHIHAPQPVPGSGASAEYAGSLLQLDFGEAGEEKRVVVVEVAAPGRPAVATSVPLVAGRPLRQVGGTWEELRDRDDLEDAWLEVVVQTTGPPSTELIDEVRARYPMAVKIRADYHTEEASGGHRVSGRPLAELYEEWHRTTHGEPDAELLELFAEIEQAVAG
jgi:DNA repair protein SbcD/Mre11